MPTANYRSPLGTIIIETDDLHITSILFANSYKGKTIDESTLNFNKPENNLLKECFRQLDEYFAGERKEFDLPLKQVGTEFQQSVWNQLMNIPYGKQISYMDLSRKLGNPKAIRAVGQTNGNNKICIVIPCHRVIGTNGSLTGYGGDLWRKKWLLEHEGSLKQLTIEISDEVRTTNDEF